MVFFFRSWLFLGALASGAAALAIVGTSSSPQPDRIGDLIKRLPGTGGGALSVVKVSDNKAPAAPAAPAAEPAPAAKPPVAEETDASREQAQRLMKAIDAILQDAARNRSEARKLPTENDYIVRPIWTETREDREKRIRDLLDSALGIVTDVPVVDLQKKI